MEKHHGNENKASVFAVEFFGTAILSLTACIFWTANNLFVTGVTENLYLNFNSWYLFMGMGCCLYSIFYLFSHISGGHFNPAISIAVYISVAFNAHNIIMLVLLLTAQFTGALSGMLLSRGLRIYITQPATYPYAPNFNSLTTNYIDRFSLVIPNLPKGELQVFAMETWCTFLFVLVFLVITHQTLRQESLKKPRDAAISGLAVAGSYVGLLALDGTVSTGLLNPAISFALVLYQQIGNWQTQPNANFIVNPSVLNINKILSPLVGGLLAALLFLWQKTMMVDKEVNYSKDALRGSI